jgi:hypothetical protein
MHLVARNLEDISHIIALREGWTENLRQQRLEEYRTFLDQASTGDAIQPTKAVDLLWHAHILHTRIYERDTRVWYGKFIHHQPYQPEGTVQALEHGAGRISASEEPNRIEDQLADCGSDNSPPLADCGVDSPPT